MLRAQRSSVVARTLEQLLAWRLADRLREGVHGLAARDRVRRDLRFVSQLQDAGSSIPRNIAEGFGRIRPREFVQFLLVARGSVLELSDHLIDGVARQHWSEEEVADLQLLCRRTTAAIGGLIRYLRTKEAEEAAARWFRKQ